MMTIDDVPESLHEYWRLNEIHDQLEATFAEENGPDQNFTVEQELEIAALYLQITRAWEEAPLFDRAKMSWRGLKDTWRTRHDPRPDGMSP